MNVNVSKGLEQFTVDEYINIFCDKIIYDLKISTHLHTNDCNGFYAQIGCICKISEVIDIIEKLRPKMENSNEKE
jgi:hypothetical protein